MKNFDFDNDTGKNIFSHPYIYYVAKIEDYKERNNLISGTAIGNALFQCQNVFEKGTTKTDLCNSKSYMKTLYTRL